MKRTSLEEQVSQFFEELQSIEKLYEQYAKSQGLTYSGFSVLKVIHETPENCTQKYICEQTFLPKQTVNILIRTFLGDGLIEMKEIDADRRNKAIQLTRSGRRYADKIMEKITRAEETAIAQLHYDQRQLMVELIRKIGNSFKESIGAG